MAIGFGILLAAILIWFGGYHIYSHYMVTKLYQYIDAGDMDKAMECIEKMPNVNTLEMCLPLYYVARTFTGGASMTGYPLYYAVSHKADINIIRALLEKGADPNGTDLGFEGHYPFRYVCRNPSKCMYEKTMLLADYGVDINTGYLYISGSFAEFSEETKESMFLTIVYLWENGAEEWHYMGTKYERTVLHEASGWMNTEYLQKFYHNEKRPMEYLLDVQDANGETPLFNAVREGMFDNCRFLIEEGADTGIRNNEGKTAYDVAVELGYEKEIEGLQQ
ncbi:MAG: hypothetical protein HDQ99_19745 [Lachnospiraceae bacterium]|nr:hypothetical protein [Lachnospiraceae bacterium]